MARASRMTQSPAIRAMVKIGVFLSSAAFCRHSLSCCSRNDRRAASAALFSDVSKSDVP